jgi:hypothetical protein
MAKNCGLLFNLPAVYRVHVITACTGALVQAVFLFLALAKLYLTAMN